MSMISKRLINWSLWFFLGHCLLCLLISLGYLSHIPWFDTAFLLPKGKILIDIFLILAMLGQVGLFALSPCLLLVLCILLFPKPKLIMVLGIGLGMLIALFLGIDTAVYKLYRFHLNGVIFQFVMGGMGTEILGLSNRELAKIFVFGAGILMVEMTYGLFLWKKIQRQLFFPEFFKWVLMTLGLSLFLSYMMIAYSVGYPINRLLVDMMPVVPFYTRVLGMLLPIQKGQLALEELSEGYLVQPRKMNASLNYPKEPLQFQTVNAPKNIVFIVIDTWRFDMLNKTVTPNLYEFAKKTLVFTNHFSGGNSTAPGIFSLFYGLPSTYWTAMETQNKGPVFIDELLGHHYQIGVFASAGIKVPAFYKTVFNSLQNLNIDVLPANNPYERDKLVTQGFKHFVNQRLQKQPFFSFLFYDAAHTYCGFKNPVEIFKPIVENCSRYNMTNATDPSGYFNRYKNALLTVDEQIKSVLAFLKAKNLMNNTVILITGDHGEEFNDNQADFWGHASNFTRYQVQTPLLIYWPGKKPQHFSHQTTHFDVVPTLTKEILGCFNKPSDYSIGSSLFDSKVRPYVIVGSYCAFGIVQPKQIIDISPTGSFRIEALNAKLLPDQELNLVVMRQAFCDLRRFYKNFKMKG